ncbi:S9 family peptidase [Parashewanella curva]|uniref:S9 family peptidase n=1 Tax=Parashewanella curva TaxID=2338552 RepID=A0A3L8Q150_9GAMM|nr:prolyl oligopeptidase family serine peptidase [Parashewanella curva]RLV61304.1 S9 family peptidase [Parashewanella curva]
MNLLTRNLALGTLSVAILSACASAPITPKPQLQTTSSAVELTAPPKVGQQLTMKQIMANPDWMGILAKQAYWSDDSSSVYFVRQAYGSPLKDYYQQAVNGTAKKLNIADYHLADQRDGVFNIENTKKAYLYQGNIFVKNLETGNVEQVTKQNRRISGVRYLSNGDLAYWQGNQIFRIHANSGLIEQLADIKMENAPKGVQQPSTYLAKQQQRLIKYVAKQHKDAVLKEQFNDQLAKQDPTVASKAWYLGKNNRVVESSLSPDGRYLFVAVVDKNYKWRSEHDIMPNYIGKDGYVDAVPARARVAEDKYPGQDFMVLDLKTHQKRAITIEGLTGYNQDVLAKVKAENAKKEGKAYDSEKTPRKLQLMVDWGWSQSPIQWHPSEDKLLVMIEAVDNKDRWIANVDLKNGRFSTEDRLHDDAWINYTHNQYGWIDDSDQYYFLSEKSGYSQLYLKQIGKPAKALTKGKYVVSEVTVGPRSQYLYYKANKTHPGMYNVYRVNIASGKSEQLTNWKGVLDYRLSPDGESLLLTASTRTRPNELYVQKIGGELKQLTNYTSKAFADYQWQAPEVVAVPSTHGAGEVYARVYLPQGFDKNNADKYPAVIFNHGAGYLQNAHYGFSGYFREYMFHNLLAQQGYVVMDMDYRGSKGYGRDWRTAIYRNMGHPEVEDLEDGVKWMAKNANVDAKRVGTYGGSYGGFLTFMALFTEPDLFQAGAALRPVTDWAHYNAPYTSNILNTPDVDPIAYERSSPIEHAEGLKKPLLIMAGVLDDNVFFQDSVRLVQRLIELEKPMFETAIYPVEPHGFKQPSSWLDEYNRIYKLFEQNLKK